MIKKEKEYLFGFEEGGWNSIFATNKRKAIRLAKKKYKNDNGLNPDESTFRINNDKEHYNALLGLFN